MWSSENAGSHGKALQRPAAVTRFLHVGGIGRARLEAPELQKQMGSSVVLSRQLVNNICEVCMIDEVDLVLQLTQLAHNIDDIFSSPRL